MAEKTRPLPDDTEEDLDEEIMDAARHLVGKTLRRGYTIENLIQISRTAISLAGGILAAVRQVKGPARPKACRSGCNYCCYLLVEISVPEVMNLVSFINEYFSAAELDALKTRVQQTKCRVHGMNSYERLFAREPCPLLQNGKCSVYAARPLVCRGYNSYNWATCAQDLKHSRSWRLIPHDEAEKDIYSDVLDGLVTGLKEEGLPSETLELIAALHIALNNPDAGERWLAGDSIFEPSIAHEE